MSDATLYTDSIDLGHADDQIHTSYILLVF